MGQKVNPHGMRVGVIKDWDSRWFTSKQAFGDTLVEDHKIRKTLKKQLYAAGVPKIEIERTVDSQTGAPRVKVNVFCAKPGIVIGKGGSESAKLEKQLAKLTGKAVNLHHRSQGHHHQRPAGGRGRCFSAGAPHRVPPRHEAGDPQRHAAP